MTQLSIAELKAQDPKRYEREYYEWLETVGGLFNADWLREDFTQQMKEQYELEVWDLRWDADTGGGAFAGKMKLSKWLELTGRTESHYPLYLWATEHGEYCKVQPSTRGSCNMGSVSWNWWTVGGPLGVFKDLPEEEWDKLISESIDELEKDIEQWLQDRADELGTQAQEEWEYRTSQEYFEEDCEVNDVTFEADDEVNEGETE